MVETSYIPQTLEEALRIRKETGAKPLAGGTDLMVMHRRGTGVIPSFPWPVMIISSLEELKYIRRDGDEIVIGSVLLPVTPLRMTRQFPMLSRRLRA